MLSFLRSISLRQPRTPSIRYNELPRDLVNYGVPLGEPVSFKEERLSKVGDYHTVSLVPPRTFGKCQGKDTSGRALPQLISEYNINGSI